MKKRIQAPGEMPPDWHASAIAKSKCAIECRKGDIGVQAQSGEAGGVRGEARDVRQYKASKVLLRNKIFERSNEADRE